MQGNNLYDVIVIGGGPGGSAAAAVLASKGRRVLVLEKEKFRQIGKAIRALTDCERECLLLRAEGLRYREIGEVLEIPTSTVGDTVDRAVKKLAEKCNV